MILIFRGVQMKKSIMIVLLLSAVIIPCIAHAQGNGTFIFNDAKRQCAFSMGYGNTYPGLGDTRTRVDDCDFILKYGYFLSEEKGTSWYRGRHELILEIPFYYVYKPESAIMTGINFLACWNFTGISSSMIPYVFAGGGPMYTNLDLSGLGAKFNGNYQAGVGAYYFLAGNMALDFNIRYHHISNGGTASPNVPMNSTKVLVGLSLFW
jgi:hypothetical protein